MQAGPKRRLLLCSSKKGIKEICTVLVGRDTLQVPLSLFWSRSSVSNIYQNFKGTNFPPEKASETCDNISGRNFPQVTDTGRVNGPRYNNFSSDSNGICNQFEKVYPNVSPTNRISSLGDRFCGNETFLPLRNFRFASFNRCKYRPKKKHDPRICGYSRTAGQRGALMVDNQHENLQWKISVNSTPRSNHIFRCIKEGLVCFVSRDYHRGSMVFSGENVAHKCSRIGSSEASNSFFYKIQKTKFDSSTDRQRDSSLSLLFIKHGRNPEQTFNRNLERNLGLPHREENTFDSRIYTKSEQSNSRLGIPKLPGQQRMETLPNCFRTNLQSFS